MANYQIIHGDWVEKLKTLPDESVQCVVTSPPYWGLRDYGTAKWEGGNKNCEHIKALNLKRDVSGGLSRGKDKGTRGEQPHTSASTITYSDTCKKCGATRIDNQLGLEKTPGEYVEKMVAGFREVKRVLRKDGTLWLNLGDSYAGSGKGAASYPENALLYKQGTNKGLLGAKNVNLGVPFGFKAKDLVGIPWMVAFALRADGWYLRQDIIWAKPNPMPESVTDRCTKSHEYIFLLTKNAKYYYDNEAIKEEATGYDGRKDTLYKGGPKDMACTGTHERWKRKNDGTNHGGDGSGFQNHSGYNNLNNPFVRNKRNVWAISTQPYKEAHFATFPPEIPRLCILAGTSGKGCCPKCGSPWERILQKKASTMNIRVRDAKKGILQKKSGFDETASEKEIKNYGKEELGESKTLGWQPACKCVETIPNEGGKSGDLIPHTPIPCTVLDPFAGAGTAGEVALKLNRNFIGIELNQKYVDVLIIPRLENVDPLFKAMDFNL